MVTAGFNPIPRHTQANIEWCPWQRHTDQPDICW